MRKLRTLIRIRRFATNERGGALVELAVLVPFLILMLAAVTELGRLFQTYNTLSKSTRAAARYLTTVTYTPQNVTNAKNVALCGKTICTGVDPVVSGLEFTNIDVTPEYKCAAPCGNPIRVTVFVQNYSFSPIFNLAGMFGAESLASLPVRPATTMYYYQVDAGGGTE
jgi:Flp pilus assembly pilin Flp